MNFKQIAKHLTISNLFNVFFAIAIVVVLINPAAKALLIRGLMKIGLFQPDIATPLNPAMSTNLPHINFRSAGGQVMDLADQKGKVVFINFWATWCPPCIAEMPSINDLHEKLKNNKNIIFITVDTDHDLSRSALFISRHQFSLPLYVADSAIPETLSGNAIPTTVIFDKSGTMVFRKEGAGDYSGPKVLAYLLALSR